ncbi:hypothetical protein M422DRAFT_147257, partial [Sphaerobolus stellatus SS14]
RGLSISPSKMELFMTQVVWAGVTLSKQGVTLDPAKMAPILQWSTPKTAMEVLSFLSTVSYFRPSMHLFASAAESLYRLTRGMAHKWDATHEKAFTTLTSMVTTAP